MRPEVDATKVLHCKIVIPKLIMTDGQDVVVSEKTNMELDFFGQIDENDHLIPDQQVASADTPFGVLTIGLRFGAQLPPE